MLEFDYTVVYWDEYLHDEITAKGIVFAKNYAEAVANVCKAYDETDTEAYICSVQVSTNSEPDEETYCVYQTESNWGKVYDKNKGTKDRF